MARCAAFSYGRKHTEPAARQVRKHTANVVGGGVQRAANMLRTLHRSWLSGSAFLVPLARSLARILTPPVVSSPLFLHAGKTATPRIPYDKILDVFDQAKYSLSEVQRKVPSAARVCPLCQPQSSAVFVSSCARCSLRRRQIVGARCYAPAARHWCWCGRGALCLQRISEMARLDKNEFIEFHELLDILNRTSVMFTCVGKAVEQHSAFCLAWGNQDVPRRPTLLLRPCVDTRV